MTAAGISARYNPPSTPPEIPHARTWFPWPELWPDPPPIKSDISILKVFLPKASQDG